MKTQLTRCSLSSRSNLTMLRLVYTHDACIGHRGYDLEIAGTNENVLWSEQVL